MKCLWCGKEMKITFRESIRKFCCDSCKNKYHARQRSQNKTIAHCLVCGKELEGRQRHYCSAECRYQAQLKRQQGLNQFEYKKPKAEENPEAKKRGRPKKGLTAAEIETMARAEGTSYGLIVAKYGL